jgi:hypothetical protein
VDVVLGVQGFPLPSKALVKIKMGEKVYNAMACLLFPPPLVALAILDSWHRLAQETHVFCAIVKGNDTLHRNLREAPAFTHGEG